VAPVVDAGGTNTREEIASQTDVTRRWRVFSPSHRASMSSCETLGLEVFFSFLSLFFVQRRLASCKSFHQEPFGPRGIATGGELGSADVCYLCLSREYAV